jgi:hypothetical protein
VKRLAGLLVAALLLLAEPASSTVYDSPPAGVWDYHAVSVGTSAVRLDRHPARNYVHVRNNGTTTLYVGFDSAVTTATGWPVPPGSELPLRLAPTVPVYGIAASGTLDVRVLEVY